jgi:hypothetical protein
MRRLICTLAAGLLAAGTVITTAGAASAGATAVHRASCSPTHPYFFNVNKNGVNYFLGTPSHTFSGAAALLKPRGNGTTRWISCRVTFKTVGLSNRGLALTSRASSPGGDVTLTPAGNGGSGFKSQRWLVARTVRGKYTYRNMKTGLYLRVRNHGPIMGQTVTTGFTATNWTRS